VRSRHCPQEVLLRLEVEGAIPSDVVADEVSWSSDFFDFFNTTPIAFLMGSALLSFCSSLCFKARLSKLRLDSDF
jgi:hypothetical protein